MSGEPIKAALSPRPDGAGIAKPQELSTFDGTRTGRQTASTGSHMQLEKHPEWTTLSRLPMRVTVGVPLPRFKVRDLLALSSGQLVLSVWSSTTDVPLTVGSAHLSWAEFEVVEQRMAVRMTRLA